MEENDGFEGYTKKNINYCLNGIAYDDVTDQLILTGKMWPYLYEIKFINWISNETEQISNGSLLNTKVNMLKIHLFYLVLVIFVWMKI